MSLFTHQDFDSHEQVLFVTDKSSGLRSIIAIHSSVLGPAAGGCRMYPYQSTDDALTDVLRLSRGMSYKNSVAGLPLGGGKSVIIADPDNENKNELLKAFARQIQRLQGQYWTAIDIGVGPKDADVMAEHCDYIFARASQYDPGFNPSSFTALGGFTGIRAALSCARGSDEVAGLRVAIQGLGATGSDLAGRLHSAGASLVVADVQAQRVRDVVERYGAVAVSPETIHAQDVDVFSPCAMGGVLNSSSIPEIKARIICGLANNQLANDSMGRVLAERSITYVPDYVVNAGGMMGASTVIFDKPSREASEKRIRGLYDTIRTILNTADSENRPASEVADEIALRRIARHHG